MTKLFGSGFHGSSTTTSYGTWLTSHNFYISLFGDFGLFGMVIFVIVFYKYFCVIFKRLIIIEGYGYERGTFVAIISLLAINMTETYFYSPVLISILIFLFAIQKAALKFHSYNKS
ncbi:hypothetical protein DSCA_09630 [Desulfosarcina alkanivorans]|uniref:Uncharacterized protein n=1 Tax=Desulfosarcina alkanivorans TaxID=571177 RepID=A0A5K7YEF3_9BACT|nr:hypothetical protein DSCA_09630 [Desulfosarcina alkanivorans]